MRFSKHVNLNRMLRTVCFISSVLGTLLFCIFLAWGAALYGFDSGYEMAKTEFAVAPSEPILLPVGGTRTYEKVSSNYGWLAFLAFSLFASSIVRLLLTKKSQQIVVVFSPVIITVAVLMLKEVWAMIILKNPAMDLALDSAYFLLLMQSLRYDWISVFLLLTLFLVEAAILTKWLRTGQANNL